MLGDRVTGPKPQPAILADPPRAGRSITFRYVGEGDARGALRRLRDDFDPASGVVGVGGSTVRALGADIPGLRAFPALSGPAVDVPATQGALWFLLRGDEPTAPFDTTAHVAGLLASAFEIDDALATFVYAGGRDLTGYEDGTENPKGDAAVAAAIVSDGGRLAGSSFVAVQRWVHDLASFHARPPADGDAIIGRRRDTNDEITDAPASAHVKRSAQESFVPAAFMLRRSMPWVEGLAQGLEFIAFGESLDRFERVLRRMAGLDDGIVDALFSFSRPTRGGYYWCPPITNGHLDLTQLGL